MKRLSIFIIICLPILSLSQKEDFNWVMGKNFPRHKISNEFDVFKIDFNFEPPKFTIESEFGIDYFNCNTSISDSLGSLIAYSNGMVIKDYNGNYIEDTLNYSYELLKQCNDWEAFNTGNSQFAEPRGSTSFNGAMFFRWGDNFMIVYNTLNYCDYVNYKLSYSMFEFDKNLKKFKMIKRDQIITEGLDNTSSLAAVRHCNGRDWWVATVSDGNEYILLHLLTKDGGIFHSKQKTDQIDTHIETGGQIAFSPNGTFLAFYTVNELFSSNGGGVCIASFDRCDGTFSNFQSKKLRQYSIGSGVSFSPDSRYLYVCNNENIYQYDTERSDIIKSERLVAKFDGFDEPFGYPINFGSMSLGPDGRIYIIPTSAAFDYVSTIDLPDESSVSCDVRQHSIHFPKRSGRTSPHLPNYRLGPLDGSACDTLGLDNHPIAKYRYEPDSIDYKRIRFTDLSYFRPEIWSWDFGDGSPKISQRSPYHTYAQNGTYKVCLTVSNENSSHTFCRYITIGPSAVDDDQAEHPSDITLFPNPVQDILLVTIGEYIPERGYIELYNISGQQVHQQRAYYGHNNVDMSGLQAGTYVLRVMDGSYLVKEEKVIKIKN